MAIYHCRIQVIGRSAGRSAVSASAYRSGTKILDNENGILNDYTRKKGVIHSEIMLCKNAPVEYMDRAILWNSVHKIEKNKNAQLAREIEVALPKEFDTQTQIEVTREYVKNFVDEGMCADWSLHNKNDGNPHVHIMLTMRPIKENGQWGEKEKKVYSVDDKGERIPIIDKLTGQQKVDKRNRKQWKREYVQTNDWNNKEKSEEWRENWANICNKYLDEKHKIDHRSYKRQGIDKQPTIHEGYAARNIEKRGGVSERCEYNRQVRKDNEELAQIQSKSSQLQLIQTLISKNNQNFIKNDDLVRFIHKESIISLANMEELYLKHQERLNVLIPEVKRIEKEMSELTESQALIKMLPPILSCFKKECQEHKKYLAICNEIKDICNNTQRFDINSIIKAKEELMKLIITYEKVKRTKVDYNKISDWNRLENAIDDIHYLAKCVRKSYNEYDKCNRLLHPVRKKELKEKFERQVEKFSDLLDIFKMSQISVNRIDECYPDDDLITEILSSYERRIIHLRNLAEKEAKKEDFIEEYADIQQKINENKARFLELCSNVPEHERSRVYKALNFDGNEKKTNDIYIAENQVKDILSKYNIKKEEKQARFKVSDLKSDKYAPKSQKQEHTKQRNRGFTL